MVEFNNDAEVRDWLHAHPFAWRWLFAVELGFVGLGPAASALAMEPNDFDWLRQIAGRECQDMGRGLERAGMTVARASANAAA